MAANKRQVLNWSLIITVLMAGNPSYMLEESHTLKLCHTFKQSSFVLFKSVSHLLPKMNHWLGFFFSYSKAYLRLYQQPLILASIEF